jgi:hypothetical protein
MSAEQAKNKGGRPSRTVDEEIAVTLERLEALKAKKREEEKRERARNQAAILAIIKAEGLDEVPAEQWKSAVEKLRALLKADKPPAPQATAPASVTPPSAAKATAAAA